MVLVCVHGSLALGRGRSDCDLDIAVATCQIMGAEQIMALIAVLASRTGYPNVLIDVNAPGQLLHRQIIPHGL